MRTLNEHTVEGDSVNHQLQIEVKDEPGAGGACHWYEIADSRGCMAKLLFQNGPIKTAGVNGVTHEALLAIVADRLRSFQAGPYACDDNEQALMAVQSALFFLQKRTRERIARNVEGTHEK